jgi:triacylglycerol esterase/lipase EstA (alpha/beta hydrolase family)
MKRMLSAVTMTAAALAFTASAQAASDYAQTKYPIVLVHGVSGFCQNRPD